jgi:hypothetical protein
MYGHCIRTVVAGLGFSKCRTPVRVNPRDSLTPPQLYTAMPAICSALAVVQTATTKYRDATVGNGIVVARGWLK